MNDFATNDFEAANGQRSSGVVRACDNVMKWTIFEFYSEISAFFWQKMTIFAKCEFR